MLDVDTHYMMIQAEAKLMAERAERAARHDEVAPRQRASIRARFAATLVKLSFLVEGRSTLYTSDASC